MITLKLDFFIPPPSHILEFVVTGQQKVAASQSQTTVIVATNLVRGKQGPRGPVGSFVSIESLPKLPKE